jgi:hypothetical protein
MPHPMSDHVGNSPIDQPGLVTGISSAGRGAFELRRWRRLRECGTVLLCWAITSAAVFAGAWFGDCFVKTEKPWSFVDSLARVDGQNYKQIIEKGYDYKDNSPSLVAFFPAFPLASWGLARVSGLDTVPAELIVSNACCLAAFLLMGAYLTRRKASSRSPRTSPVDVEGGKRVASYALLAMGLLPTTFFFRMAYTESMFLCATVAAMYGIARGWKLPIVALIVGLATAVRPVGVALVLPLVWYVWQTSVSKRQLVWRLAYAIPFGCWGLLAYMAYQYWKFDEPLAFALTQEYHRIRPPGTLGDKVMSLLSWEPIRDAYDRSSVGYWRTLFDMKCALFSMEFANPIYLIGTASLVVVGALKRWLTSYEVQLSIPLLVIPYATRAYEMRMLSQGRFAAVVFPMYIVLGHLLARMPTAVAVSLLAFSGLMMGIYAALFAAGYPFL